jgi:lipopolysaccharide/colanic/teichoic acid biosynthesis glycosyltransferase
VAFLGLDDDMAIETQPFEPQVAFRLRDSARGPDESVWQPQRAWYLHVKLAVDFVLALVMLIVAAPVILLAALLVKLTSAGPAFYSQKRVGRFGRLFTIYKLRSMTHNCERQ